MGELMDSKTWIWFRLCQELEIENWKELPKQEEISQMKELPSISLINTNHLDQLINMGCNQVQLMNWASFTIT